MKNLDLRTHISKLKLTYETKLNKKKMRQEKKGRVRRRNGSGKEEDGG